MLQKLEMGRQLNHFFKENDQKIVKPSYKTNIKFLSKNIFDRIFFLFFHAGAIR